MAVRGLEALRWKGFSVSSLPSRKHRPRTVARRAAAISACAAVFVSTAAVLTGLAGADPADWGTPPPPDYGETYTRFADPARNNDAPAALLPMIAPTPTNWAPRFPFPFDQTRDKVTEADITAEREMCQWYNAQYDVLTTQIDRFNVHLVAANGNYQAPGITEEADAVTANLDESLDFLTPRAQALSTSTDYMNDLTFNLYQGESFYRLWQQMSNVRDGIKGRQPTWFTGPSLQHAMRFGSKINRSQVCD